MGRVEKILDTLELVKLDYWVFATVWRKRRSVVPRREMLSTEGHGNENIPGPGELTHSGDTTSGGPACVEFYCSPRRYRGKDRQKFLPT